MVTATEAMAATAVLARACSLYRWTHRLSVHDFAQLTGVSSVALMRLEISYQDDLTDDERERLRTIAAAPCVPDA